MAVWMAISGPQAGYLYLDFDCFLEEYSPIMTHPDSGSKSAQNKFLVFHTILVPPPPVVPMRGDGGVSLPNNAATAGPGQAVAGANGSGGGMMMGTGGTVTQNALNALAEVMVASRRGSFVE